MKNLNIMLAMVLSFAALEAANSNFNGMSSNKAFFLKQPGKKVRTPKHNPSKSYKKRKLDELQSLMNRHQDILEKLSDECPVTLLNFQKRIKELSRKK